MPYIYVLQILFDLVDNIVYVKCICDTTRLIWGLIFDLVTLAWFIMTNPYWFFQLSNLSKCNYSSLRLISSQKIQNIPLYSRRKKHNLFNQLSLFINWILDSVYDLVVIFFDLIACWSISTYLIIGTKQVIKSKLEFFGIKDMSIKYHLFIF